MFNNSYLNVLFLSMLPITELRVAIPLGLEVFKLPWWQVWFLSVIGNMIPTFFILYFIPYVFKLFTQHSLLGKFLYKQRLKTINSFKGHYTKYGMIGLVFFVGIPLPFTGAWSGSLAAFIFGVPFKKAWYLIFLGVCLSATIVTLITVFAGGFWRLLFLN